LHYFVLHHISLGYINPMSGFSICGNIDDEPKSARPQGVTFDFSKLPIATSTDALCELRDGTHCPMASAAQRLVASQCLVPPSAAVSAEVERAEVALLIRRAIVQVIDTRLVKPSRVTSTKTCNSALNIASGLFPAIVFEYVSLRETFQEDETLDPVIPSTKIFRNGVAHSVTKRLAPFVHDLLRCQGEAGLAKCEEICREMMREVENVCSTRTTALQSAAEPMEVVTRHHEDTVSLSAGSYQHILLTSHYEKLRRFYIGPDDQLDTRIFVVCQRYFVLAGAAEDPSQEGGWHGSVPPGTMHLIGTTRSDFGGECFASPLNASCGAYYSAFPDVDCYFGSVGSFFSGPTPLRGLFEANPPFEHSTVLAMARRMRLMLEASGEPLAFLVVLPWADKGRALNSLKEFRAAVEEGGMLGPTADLKGSSTPFVDGYQQSSRECAFTSRLDTRLLLLQNRAHASVFSQEQLKSWMDNVVSAWCGINSSKRLRAAE
jgi:hypothetical protein